MPRVPRGDAHNPHAKDSHRCALGKRRHSAIAERHSNDEEADHVIACIAQKIEGIGLKRGRARQEARSNLDGERRRVDPQYQPKYTPIRSRVDRSWIVVAVVAAGPAHDSIRQSWPFIVV